MTKSLKSHTKTVKITKFIALDLEFNQPSGNIIEVGVAIGDITQPSSSFITKSWIIDPNEPLNPEISRLTRISDSMIATQGVPLSKCLEELALLMNTQEVFINPVTWGQGDTLRLQEAANQQQIQFNAMGRRYIDVKTIHSFFSLAHGKSIGGGLSSAMAAHKLAFIGQAHRADVDAFNTLRLFAHLVNIENTKHNLLNQLTNLKE